MTAEAMEALLRDHGCSMTTPRRAIVRFLAGNDAHPTAADVFEAITRDDPQASRATVYNTLTLLTEIGALRIVRVGDEARYDPNTDHHHHALCPRCGALADVSADAIEVRVGGKVEATARVQLERVCPTCAG
jgi:Fur family peroxide stress response transcriptional regulator